MFELLKKNQSFIIRFEFVLIKIHYLFIHSNSALYFLWTKPCISFILLI